MSKLVSNIGAQCDQLVRLFFNIWPFAIMKIGPIMSQISQSQLRNKLSKICQRLVNFCQSGEISPNLVTLPIIHVSVSWFKDLTGDVTSL